MKKIINGTIAVTAAVLFLFSCSRRITPTEPRLLSTPTAVSAFGSISGNIQLKPLVCPPCPITVRVPIIIASPTPGGPTDTPTAEPTSTYTPVHTAITACSGATVKALQNGVEKASVLTDASGNFKLSNLVPGVYDLQVTIPQYDVDNSMTGITVTAGVDSAGHNLGVIKRWAPGELMVFFDATVTDAQARQIIASYGCTITTAYTNNPAFLSYYLTIPADKTPPQMEAVFSALPGVRSAGRESYGCGCPI